MQLTIMHNEFLQKHQASQKQGDIHHMFKTALRKKAKVVLNESQPSISWAHHEPQTSTATDQLNPMDFCETVDDPVAYDSPVDSPVPVHEFNPLLDDTVTIPIAELSGFKDLSPHQASTPLCDCYSSSPASDHCSTPVPVPGPCTQVSSTCGNDRPMPGSPVSVSSP